METVNRWQLAIDVGGTFTDCVARSPAGQIVRQKLLSSGEVLGPVGGQSHADCVTDPMLTEPAGFWDGYQLQLRDRAGQILGSSPIRRHEAGGLLWLAEPLPTAPAVDHAYALSSGEGAPVLAIRRCLQAALSERLPAIDLRLGSTWGTNALLTHSGARTAFVVTRGCADLLRIGFQDRPRLFELTVHKPAQIYQRVVEIDERLAADGRVLQPADARQIHGQLDGLYDDGIQSVAICLLHAYLNPQHELLVASVAEQLGFSHVHLSHQVSPLRGAIRRAQTTLTDAYLGPVLANYLVQLQNTLHPDSQLRLMTSAGGLVEPALFSGKDSLLSGPAGGVVGYAVAAQRAGIPCTIGFDMGGTSTDVSRFEDDYQMVMETSKNGANVSGPAMDIETVAAGGGSLCRFDGVRLLVGPDSAGADPGPACYGRGGPLTVTDMNLALGRLLPEHFPFPLDRDIVLRRLASLSRRMAQAGAPPITPQQLAAGFVRIANTQMAEAIRTISVNQGTDPRDHVLAAFGGAAPQHACALAAELGLRKIMIHPDGGILSAVGIAAADLMRHATTPIYQQLTPTSQQQARAEASTLTARLAAELAAEHAAAQEITTSAEIELRYQAQEATLRIAATAADWQQAFESAHRRRFGYASADRQLEIVAVRARAVGRTVELAGPSSRPSATDSCRLAASEPIQTVTTYWSDHPQDTPVFVRQDLRPGQTLVGPAIVVDDHSTIIVEPGWQATVQPDDLLLMEDSRQLQRASHTDATVVDPITLEVCNCRFAAIARQMGVTLQKTASSVNVKERRDFSCAVFTPSGDLVVNAPHMPVHLGSMSVTVRHVIADHPDLRDGDVLVTNDPYRGGSHLPDVTVVTPVFADSGELLFFTASRAHHAEIGGMRPGSMPPDSTNLAEEGVLIRSMKIIDAGQPRLAELQRLLETAPFPSRAVPDNLEDIRAQIASNRQGADDLLRMCGEQGTAFVQAYMQHIQDAAAAKMRLALQPVPNGEYHFADCMDDGSALTVKITIEEETATVDFTGSADTHPGNLNANPAIVRAAVIYCFRCLIDEDIPLNEGVLEPIRIVIPKGILNPPRAPATFDCPAVVGGNVETSQRIVDVILGALGLAAASQGTMNNLLFGDDRFGYYETICGGTGATPDGAGADAVHSHMTNTRLTDPEILEHRFPVRLHRFAIRVGSGGAGLHVGGDGVVRELEFLKAVDVSLLTSRRNCQPFGLAGGAAGRAGENELVRASGARFPLAGIASFHAHPGDRLVIRTPGGGGWKKGDET